MTMSNKEEKYDAHGGAIGGVLGAGIWIASYPALKALEWGARGAAKAQGQKNLPEPISFFEPFKSKPFER
jgi:hypothetical protein